MAVFRILVLLLLLGAAGCFGLYVLTGRPRYRRLGLVTLKWTLFGVLGFFAVLSVQRFM